jgi:molybdate transport system substrate-binding protein
MRRFALIALFAGSLPAVASAEAVRLFAAGSLKAVISEAARAFEAKAPGVKVELEFGPSGLLRERIEKGEAAHVFASADVGHPAKLAEAGRAASRAAVFARTRLCALAGEGLDVTSATLLATLLDAAVRVGISTPKADPSGDYAFALFAKADALKVGARAALEAKALQLTGGPTCEKAPPGRNPYAWVMAGGKADIFLTYCTNAVLAQKEEASLRIVQVPPELAVGADYGLIVLKDAPPAAHALARFILGEAGQAVLARHGFGPGDGPPR